MMLISDDEVKNLTVIYTQPIMAAVEKKLGAEAVGRVAIEQMEMLAVKIDQRDRDIISESVVNRMALIDKRVRQHTCWRPFSDHQFVLFNEVDREFGVKIKRDRSMTREDLIRQVEELIKAK